MEVFELKKKKVGGGREVMILMSLLMKMMIGDGLRERVEGRRGEGEAGVVVLMILIHLRMMEEVEGRSVGANWRLLLTPMFLVMTEHALEGVPLSGLMRRRAGNVIAGGKTEVKDRSCSAISHASLPSLSLVCTMFNNETCLWDLIFVGTHVVCSF